jgi:threonine dehydratase
MFGSAAIVVMPEDVIAAKVAAVRSFGAQAVLAGRTITDRQVIAESLAEQHGYEMIPPFDDPRVVAGQATVGVELLEQAANIDAVLVPIGGGGLIAGIGTAIKAKEASIRIVGVEPAGKPAAYQSLKRGYQVTLEAVDTCADGLRASHVGVLNFAIMQECVDEILLVEEQAIRDAMRLLILTCKLTVEPAGAVGLAALLGSRPELQGKRVVVILSGGNVDAELLADVLHDEPVPQSTYQ